MMNIFNFVAVVVGSIQHGNYMKTDVNNLIAFACNQLKLLLFYAHSRQT